MSKRVWLLCFFVILFAVVAFGCASVQKATDYYEACRNDYACYAQMVQNGNISEAVVRSTVKSTKLEDFLGAIAFNLGSGLTGLVLGRKLKRC